MSDEDVSKLEEAIGKVVAKHYRQALSIVATLAFLLGGWLTRMEYNFSRLAESETESSDWRKTKDATDNRQDQNIAALQAVTRIKP